MADVQTYQYEPDYSVPPGVVLDEYLDDAGMSQKDLARRTGLTPKTVSGIIQARAPISMETAFKLERVLGRPARFWVNLEQQFQEARQREAEHEKLKADLDWLECFPVRAMVNRGWLPNESDKVAQLEQILRFFGIASPARWDNLWGQSKVAYRKTKRFEPDPHALSAWLRQGEIEAGKLQCAPFDKSCFRQVLADARGLTRESPAVFQPWLVESCAQAGVAVVFVPELEKSRASGCTRWIGDKPMIQLSLRYKTNDHLWFTLFHEAGHILKHGKKAVFLEGNGLCDEKEQEANAFAADCLISPVDMKRFVAGGNFTEGAIRDFSESVNIAPGIVVGRLQHDGLVRWGTKLNRLKVSLRWKAESGQ